MQVSIQSAGADPGDRLIRDPGHPAPMRPSPGRMGAQSPGGRARWHWPRRFGIGTGSVAQWPAQWRQSPGGATAGEAGPPGYARRPDYLVSANLRTVQNLVATRRSGL